MAEEPDARTVVTKLLELARVDAAYLKDLERLRQAVVVMFTDIQGSTAYFEKHGDAAGLLMVHSCNRTIRQIVEKHQGRVIKSIGDGMMATFTNPVFSVEGAIEIQKILAEVNEVRPEPERIGVRIGVHYGVGIVRTDDVFGDVVNMASRVESEAAPGQIVISDELYKQIDESRFTFRELGRFMLKGKTSEHTLFQVIWNPVETPAPQKEASAAPEILKRSPLFRIQVVKHDGSLGPQHPVMPQLTIGRTQGDLRFSADASMAPLNARVFVQDGQLLVEDLSEGVEKVFVRLVGGHTLQTGDVIIMGQQVFRFREIAGAMSAVTQFGISIHELNNVLDKLDNPVAELAQIDADGNEAKRFPLSSKESQFGRTKGNYIFPEDKMMSRVHARILLRGEDFLLEDSGSRNGTFVNLRGKTPVADGSAILVGSQLFRVQS
jgi:class 3 adenylate cyclase